MKIKLGKGTEWTIYAENEQKQCVMGICFPNMPTKKKVKEIQQAIQAALAEIHI